jgi:hypothetical protein
MVSPGTGDVTIKSAISSEPHSLNHRLNDTNGRNDHRQLNPKYRIRRKRYMFARGIAAKLKFCLKRMANAEMKKESVIAASAVLPSMSEPPLPKPPNHDVTGREAIIINQKSAKACAGVRFGRAIRSLRSIQNVSAADRNKASGGGIGFAYDIIGLPIGILPCPVFDAIHVNRG